MNTLGFTDCAMHSTPEAVPLYFIVNPSASNGGALGIWSVLKTWLDEQNIPYCFVLTRDSGHVEQAARQAAAVPGAVVAAVGGDGTLSRVADALAGTEAVLGVIPAGTGNDFARTFHIPTDPVEACSILLKGQTIYVDAGRLNGQLFLNVVGAGLDAEVVADANRIFKKMSGALGYVLALFKQLLFFRPQSLRITIDGDTMRTKAWLVTVANACYYGGGMKVAPGADPQDGLVDVVIVSDIHRIMFLRLFPLVYSGRHVTHPAVRVVRGKHVTVECEKALHVHADGELYGTTPLNVTVIHHAVKLKVPEIKE